MAASARSPCFSCAPIKQATEWPAATVLWCCRDADVPVPPAEWGGWELHQRARETWREACRTWASGGRTLITQLWKIRVGIHLAARQTFHYSKWNEEILNSALLQDLLIPYREHGCGACSLPGALGDCARCNVLLPVRNKQ